MSAPFDLSFQRGKPPPQLDRNTTAPDLFSLYLDYGYDELRERRIRCWMKDAHPECCFG